MEKIYNVGIVGFGMIGKVHAFACHNLDFYYRPAPLKTRLFAVCTGRPETAKEAKERFGFEFTTTDFRELVNHPEVDIVSICSPNVFHREQVLAAMAAGKHIYCEKPLVCNSAEAEEVEKALAGYSGIHRVVFHIRFYPAILKARELIDRGLLGEPISFRVAYYHSGGVDRKKPISWKQEKEMGGGVLADMGSHAIDLVYFLLGNFDRIFVASRVLYPERPTKNGIETKKVEAEDYVIINAKLKNGALGVIEASKVATGSQDEFKFEIYGTGGALRFNSMEPNFLEFYNQSEPDEPLGGEAGFKKIVTVSRYPAPASGFPGPKFSVGWLRGHVHSLENFLENIRDNRIASPSFREGIYNVRILDAARRSEAGQTWTAC